MAIAPENEWRALTGEWKEARKVSQEQRETPGFVPSDFAHHNGFWVPILQWFLSQEGKEIILKLK